MSSTLWACRYDGGIESRNLSTKLDGRVVVIAPPPFHILCRPSHDPLPRRAAQGLRSAISALKLVERGAPGAELAERELAQGRAHGRAGFVHVVRLSIQIQQARRDFTPRLV